MTRNNRKLPGMEQGARIGDKSDSGREGTLDDLKVIERLEIGPVRIEPRRVSAPYRVVREGGEETNELIYRFEEDVFEKDEAASLNLGSVMCAQVALNYGLFCGEIVFNGWFDDHDRRFLQRMCANTAREIYVKKLLEPNPFLTGAAARMGVERREDYGQAVLRFELPPTGHARESGPQARPPWKVSPGRHLVLSSGGKDSLLSYGLLKEIGCEVHPVFVNESGRHWFTALNAYRYFSAGVPATARVWTNADRIFNWMLRHLPFVRADFADIRSDEYPIRLWTVAVFLFGVLPLARKRGIGRIVVGDEYDTTRRYSHRGITHYDGLYDQSRWFDNALTRYYHRKGWGLCQFSILRPLSEILIQKTLLERYPELQARQVSCHAAHKDGDRVRPCGRCEKCRRIVGMIEAVGGDPHRCGYTDEQVAFCLKALAEKGAHQESAGVQHLLYLLRRKGHEGIAGPSGMHVRPRPEVMKIRFDPERSPPEEIPRDLRLPLLTIYGAHADGAVKRNGRLWIPVDPMSDPVLSRPYPFEPPDRFAVDGAESGGGSGDPSKHFLLGDLTWPEAKKRFREVDVALLPVGAIEQHGPHLPLDTDAFDAEYLTHQVALRCSDPRPVVLPLIPYGVSYHHDDFSGTIGVSPDSLSRIVYDVGMSAARNGVTKLVIINGHGGNIPALHFAAQMINRDAHIFTCVDTGESSDADIEAIAETPNDVHAGEIETSTSLAVRPEGVRMQAARKFVPRFSSRYLDFSSKRGVGWYAHTAKLSPSGVLGDPTRATAEKGRRMWEQMIRNLVEFVEHLKGLTLDELYQRRY
ncbi:Creatininase [uncultured Desulfatiglans sp.]|uniref:Creatininase n=1 Tax=Uncultured Desulfatiglans sp. TaxID=1748965 RepID=A0A653A514_UNCDX|nr:Creatininase [uncultured Desulfatiglans sp.]